MCFDDETPCTITMLAQRYAELSVEISMTQTELESQLHHAVVWKKDWDKVLWLLELAKNGVSHWMSRECAACAVQKAPIDIVEAILEHLPDDEFAEKETYEVDWAPSGGKRRWKWEVHVQGTLVMHAVAANRPDVLQLLLERGHDVNCASARAAKVLIRDCGEQVVSYGTCFIPFHAWTARPENCVKLRKEDEDPEEIPPVCWDGATPLALAVMLGHPECVQILLDHGAWMEESPAVSRAMYLFWREEDPAYQKARRLVLQTGDHARHRPILWAVGQTASPGQLNRILENWQYTPEELEQAAHSMTWILSYQRDLWENYADGWRDLCRRLCIIGQVSPEALRARSVVGLVLDRYMHWKDIHMDDLLPFWKGAVLDLSGMEDGGLYYLSQAEHRRFFERLSANSTLVMDRNAVPAELAVSVLRFLVRTVRFLPPVVDRGVSGLTQQILRSGDLHLIRSALNNGIIPPEESTAELLACQQMLGLPPTCRSVLLTARRLPMGQQPVEPRREGVHRRWFPERIREDSVPLLEEEDWRKWFWPSLQTPYQKWSINLLGEDWESHHIFWAACMEGRREIVKAWIQQSSRRELYNTSSLVCPRKNVHTVLTPLCAAAFAGQTEIVELLLEHGMMPREELWGTPSVWTDQFMIKEECHIPLSPVMVAALGEHWDTIKVLLDHGAAWNPANPEMQLLWKKFHAQPLEAALQKHRRLLA